MNDHEVVGMLITGLGLIAGGFVAYKIWWHLKYRHEESALIEDKGVVTDMNYTPPRSTWNAATKNMQTSPAIHRTYLKLEKLGEWNFNDVELYQAVRLDDEVKVEYVEVWRVEKANKRNRVFVKNKVVTVYSPKGRKIAL